MEIILRRIEVRDIFIGARLFHHILHHLNLPKDMKTSFWSDSTIVLHWIKNNYQNLETFVTNRVIKIQKLFYPYSWNFCPGNKNPADTYNKVKI